MPHALSSGNRCGFEKNVGFQNRLFAAQAHVGRFSMRRLACIYSRAAGGLIKYSEGSIWAMGKGR
jgi:hypothetical protein